MSGNPMGGAESPAPCLVCRMVKGGDANMPMYVFRCDDGHDFEKLMPMSAEPPDCEVCGLPARKVPTSFGYNSGTPRPRKPAPKFNSRDLWRDAFKDRPDRLKREVEFRAHLAATGTPETEDIPSPDRNLTGGVALG